ncbi:hypothetical protein POVCU1_040910, partial [Plasmodium ovale curtisi]
LSASSPLSRRSAVSYLVGQQSLISSDSSPLSRRTAVPYLVGQQSLISSDSSPLSRRTAASQKHGNFNTRKKVENKEDKITFETPLQ